MIDYKCVFGRSLQCGILWPQAAASETEAGLSSLRRQSATYLFYFIFTSLIADGPRCHPACVHEESSRLSPVYALRIFTAMQVQHDLTTRQAMVELFTYITLSGTDARIKILLLTRIEPRTSAQEGVQVTC